MKRSPQSTLLSLGCLLLAAVPALAQYPPPPPPPYPPPPVYAPPPPPSHPHDQFVEFRVWAGDFLPAAGGTFWNNNFANFTGGRSDFQNVIGGGDFVFHFDRYNALMVSVSGYSGSSDEAYRGFLDQNNNSIVHRTSLDISSGTVAYALYPAGTHNPVIPYLGAGIGVYGWRLREGGDFIDFSNNNTIFSGASRESGAAPGYFFMAGLEFPVSRHVALLVDGRYTVAHANLNGEFAGFGRLDLSGGQVVGGVAFHL
jgi:opacity protein-like surface antigen